MKYTFTDKTLGTFIIQINPRATRFTFRIKDNKLYATIPPNVSRKQLQEAIDGVRSKLENAQLQLAPKRIIDFDFKIDAPLFKLSLEPGKTNKYYSRTEEGKVTIICPPDTNFNDEELQTWLHKVVEEALKRSAKLILPTKLSQLSKAAKLPFSTLRISASHGRWGSCSTAKSISLSCYLLLLPEHLIDYVLLHELCHTREMNHGKLFWTLLDSLTDNKAHALRNEIKNYRTSF
jgi:predicted metal-dependent hydrolase